MSILEDNKVLADYMKVPVKEMFGMLFLRTDITEYDDTIDEPTYSPDSDWNQLMEAVEKIENESHVDVSICHRSCIIHDFSKGMPNLATCAMARGSKIEAVYQAVLEYIKQQKEKSNG